MTYCLQNSCSRKSSPSWSLTGDPLFIVNAACARADSKSRNEYMNVLINALYVAGCQEFLIKGIYLCDCFNMTKRTKSPKNSQIHFKYLDPEIVIRVKTHCIQNGLTYRVFVVEAL